MVNCDLSNHAVTIIDIEFSISAKISAYLGIFSDFTLNIIFQIFFFLQFLSKMIFIDFGSHNKNLPPIVGNSCPLLKLWGGISD